MAQKKEIKKKVGNITAKFIKLSSQLQAPTIKIQQGDTYVKFGDDNMFPYYLLELFNNSGLSSSIIKRKINMLVGTDVNYEEPTDEILMANRYQTVKEVLRKCAGDLEVFGGYYLQTIKETGSNDIAEYYHVPFEKVRSGIPNEFGITEEYFVWTKQVEVIKEWTSIGDFTSMPAFTLDGKEAEIMAVKNDTPGNIYYPTAIYNASLLDIQTYQEISNYNNSNLHNGFTPGLTIMFRGPEPSEEAQDEIVKQLKNKYQGSDSVGTPMIFFLDGEQENPVVEAIDTTNIADQYKELLKTITDNIIVAHQIPRQIVGVSDAGSLGNSKEILQASQMFRSDYVKPQQELLLEGFNIINAINGKEDYVITNPSPNVLLYDMTELLLVLDKNEVRELLGYEETDEVAEVIPTNNEIKTEEDDK